jgi:hypothetical protein
LLHRQKRHAMRGCIVEAHVGLRIAHAIGKRTAARNDNRASLAMVQSFDPPRKLAIVR